MTEPTLKRNTAYKLRIGGILMGKPIINGERFSFLELGDKKIARVNVVGNVIDKYESQGEKKYTFLTLDDGSGQIKVKAFGDDTQITEKNSQGETILIIGTLRYFNTEIYISPEISKSLNPKYLLVRKLEVEKKRNNIAPIEINKEKIFAIKDKILNLIKDAEHNEGKETDEIIIEIKEATPDMINQEIKKLHEEGIIFEPRPGKLRYLG